VRAADETAQRRPEVARSVELPFALPSVKSARQTVRADLIAAGVVEPQRTDALVVLSELLANSVRHARSLPGDKVQVLWRVGLDEVEVAVADGGAQTSPRPERPPFTALSGRGLGIVESLAGSWGVEGAGTDYQLVWAIVDRSHGE
jgi:anti-sigma regulatory factor (Ser/Thr protein kinase)